MDYPLTGPGGSAGLNCEQPVQEKECTDTTPLNSSMQALDVAQSRLAMAVTELSTRLDTAGMLELPELRGEDCSGSAPAPWPVVASIYARAAHADEQTGRIHELLRRLAV
ncbi:MAG: hypothetical protein K2Q20_15050 [Phycisphaerales bacterium]|nr:hypothetical protein [Phycisphaerales bacterium]